MNRHVRDSTHIEELERFNTAAVGREHRMIELKKEVNALAVVAGKQPRYNVAFAECEA